MINILKQQIFVTLHLSGYFQFINYINSNLPVPSLQKAVAQN